MISEHSVPWYDRPAREYPIKRWLRKRYPFYVPPSLFARYPTTPAQAGSRPFPAKLWAMQGRLPGAGGGIPLPGQRDAFARRC